MSVVVKPTILLPKKDVSYEKWASVACDQFAAEPSYWDTLFATVGACPSTANLVFPECFLQSVNQSEKTNQIVSTMHQYLKDDLFYEVNNFVLVERTVGAETRVGLVVAIDLDAYNWERVRVPVRATEDTIVDRLPVRIAIRKEAPIELTHTMVLLDDKENSVIEPLYQNSHALKKLYDFELNMGGGRIVGYEVPNSEATIAAIEALADPKQQVKKYGKDAGIMLAVGDGNHSMATAKVLWEEKKKTLSTAEQKNHPARYFLAELVNIYGGGMQFEPIHRMVFAAGDAFVAALKKRLSGEGQLKIITQNGEECLACPSQVSRQIAAVQTAIEEIAKEDKALFVEYVHNESRLKEILKKEKGVGIVMPKFPAEELFDYVVNVGNLPKKAFSIGEPEEKRYYLEAKRI